tara:strand:- start:943 stop:1503 length:561 start_codon:yes stop_codon:yes gene_type:complete
MGEVGCLKDGNFQNLQVEGKTILVGKTVAHGHLTSSKLLQSHAVANVAPTAISATELSVNTFYKSIAAATAMTLPSAALGNIGDFISVFYVTAVGGGNAHTYTTTTDTKFAFGSTAQRVGGAAPSTADVAVAGSNILTITGHAKGDGGCGTSVKFVNMTGATDGWAVEAITYNQGDGSEPATIAFS